jgi:fibronectin type III domain protein
MSCGFSLREWPGEDCALAKSLQNSTALKILRSLYPAFLASDLSRNSCRDDATVGLHTGLIKNRLMAIIRSAAAVAGSLSLLSGSLAPAQTTQSVSLAWDAPNDPSVVGYNVHYGTSSGSYTITQDAGASTTATVSGLQTGIPYYFAVTAYNASGINSAYSNEVSYTPTASQPLPLAIDAMIFFDQVTGSSTVVTPSFSTVSGNELFLAFVATDYVSGENTTVTNVTGAGLSWTLVQRSNTQGATAEIWCAFTPLPLSQVNVTATLSQSVTSSITVMTFTGADTSGTNGSGAIGATGTGNSSSGAPTASLITTRNGSWILGVGADSHKALDRTADVNQTIVHQDLEDVPPAHGTFWVQMQNTPTPLSGTTVIINDTAPTQDGYDLSICEVLPAL